MCALTIDRTAGITTGPDELPPAPRMLRSRMQALAEELDCERRAPVAADPHGPLHEVVDSLAARGPLLAEPLEGDAARREPLTWLRAILAPAPTS